MIRNSHILYDDFISLVENSNPATYWNNNMKDAKDNFKFTDMEIGKIYAFKIVGEMWFITPIKIISESEYVVHWGFMRGDVVDIVYSEMDYCSGWDNIIWGGERWLVLGIVPPFKYINWTDDPFEVKS